MSGDEPMNTPPSQQITAVGYGISERKVVALSYFPSPFSSVKSFTAPVSPGSSLAAYALYSGNSQTYIRLDSSIAIAPGSRIRGSEATSCNSKSE